MTQVCTYMNQLNAFLVQNRIRALDNDNVVPPNSRPCLPMVGDYYRGK